METTYCYTCKRQVENNEYLRTHVGQHNSSPVGRAKRDPKGLLQRRVGPARERRTNLELLTRAVGPTTAVRALVELWNDYANYHEAAAIRDKSDGKPVSAGYFIGRAEGIRKCAGELKAALQTGAPPRAERARRPNADLRQDADREQGT